MNKAADHMRSKQVKSVLLLVLALAFFTVLMLSLAASDFVRRMAPNAQFKTPAKLAVVFTGEFNRVHEGLALLTQERVSRLFISGVNLGAGIQPSQFATQFSLDAAMRAALQSGKLVLGPNAQNTFQNAAETACWVQEQGISGPILLITSTTHMPRASLALEKALPGREIQRLSTKDEGLRSAQSNLGAEFIKFTATGLTWHAAGPAPMPCPVVQFSGEHGQPHAKSTFDKVHSEIHPRS